MVDMLAEMNGWIDEIAPLDQQTRFGNKAYRIWNQRLVDVSFHVGSN